MAASKIERIRKDLVHSLGLTLDEAKVAAKVRLINKDQIWWWTEEWQKGEREAEAEFRPGKTVGPFDSADDLIADLRKRTRQTRKVER